MNPALAGVALAVVIGAVVAGSARNARTAILGLVAVMLFGAFLVFTGIKLAVHKETEIHPERNPVLRLFRRIMPVTEGYEGQRFFVRRGGRLFHRDERTHDRRSMP